MSVVRVGVVGVGRFGRQHLEAYRQIERAEIVGVVDAHRETASRAAAAYGVPVFDSVAELLRHARPQAVSIVVPASLRGSLIDEIAGFGAAALIEKPLAAHGPAAVDVVARWSERPVMVGHVLRFAAPYRRLLRELDDRRHLGVRSGRCSRIRGRDHLDLYPGEDVVGLTLVHDIDAAQWLSGSYTETVRAVGRRSCDGRWLDVDARLTMVNGASWHLHASWTDELEDRAAAADLELVVAADRSRLTATGVEVASWTGAEALYDRALREELDHFIDCTISDTPSDVLLLADAAAAVRVVDAARVSLGEGGEPVELAWP